MQFNGTVTISQTEYEALLASRTENVVLEHQNSALEQKNLVLEQKNALLRFQMAQLQRALFGRKSERFVPNQPGNVKQLTFEFEGEQLQLSEEQTVQEAVTAYERKKPQKEKQPHPGRLPIPKHFRREEITIEPDEDTTDMVYIGSDYTETLEYTPAEIWVKRIIRPKYAKKDPKEGESPILQAAAPESILQRSKAGVSLVSHILISKYLEHMPLDRLLQRFARRDLKIPRQTIGGWVKYGILPLEVLYKAYQKWLFDSDYLQIDETTIKILEDGKGKCHLGYFWVVFDPLTHSPFFHYHKGRDHSLPKLLLEEFKGEIQCDGYSVYETIQSQKAKEIRLLNCLAHIRRKFFDAKSNDEANATQALALIARIYQTEAIAREGQLDHKQRLALRLEKSKPYFELFEKWLHVKRDEVLPKSPIGLAISYALNRWDNMQPIMQDGRFEVDNNLVENVIRPVALGRKNYLFAGSHEAAQRSAIIYTFFSACKHHGVNPEVWLPDVLTRINDTKRSDLITLFPQYWKENMERPS